MLLGDLKSFYDSAYLGEPIEDEDFPRLQARAEDALMAATFGRLSGHPPGFCGPMWDAVMRAACAQVEFMFFNGFESGYGVGNNGGFTVGHVSVNAGRGDVSSSDGSINGLCQKAAMYLLPTGLMYSGGVLL